MDSRVCQFNLRGRCNRGNCEFKHVSPSEAKDLPSPAAGTTTTATKAKPCRFWSGGTSCRFGDSCRFSHESSSSSRPPPDSDEEGSDLFKDDSDEDESLVSGFTETASRKGNNAQPMSSSAAAKSRKKTIEDLSKDWSDDDEDEEEEEEQNESPPQPDEKEQVEAKVVVANEVESAEDDESAAKPEGQKEEWVTLIFGEDGKPSSGAPESSSPQVVEETNKSNVYDLTPDTDTEKDREWPLRRRGGGARVRGGLRSRPKREGVTKIGNNMYFYTGGDSSAPGEEEDESAPGGDTILGESDSQEESTSEWTKGRGPASEATDQGKPTVVKQRRKTKKHKAHRTDYVYAGKSTAAKTRRCGECENCNKEDCNKCDACRDKPRNGGKGLKKQACVFRVCLWKNPSGKANAVPGTRPRGRPRTRPPGLIKTSSNNTTTPSAEEKKEKTTTRSSAASAAASAATTPRTTSPGRLSLPVIDPKNSGGGKNRLDAELPEFDPDKFKPGFNPPVVKKGDSEYVVVVTGIKDTGLCGKYWGNSESLPSKRRLRLSGDEDEDMDSESPGEGQMVEATEPETPQPPPPKKIMHKRSAKKDTPPPTTRKYVKRKLSKKNSSAGNSSNNESSSPSKKPREESILSDVSNNVASLESVSLEADKRPSSEENGVSSIRSVSCVADTSTQREVTVECFAPYDDHRWVNIGKERDNMAPDSVMYARALRPPYHLLSFLRIKGNSTKGMSCTDRNTMVFVVLEGEISVVLHTTQFSASKGDSFYIPPKNYYNLINQKVREAELSLIQFQYDGPLPTVAASSQSGGAGTSTATPASGKP